jgi:aryl-alcohol dehydrogenase-like predicted oxidoreductase
MRYIILGQHTGLRVPELVLGTGMFGTKWGHGADRDESRRMAAASGLATIAWSPLGGGVLTGKYCKGEAGRQTGMGGWLFHAEDTPQKIAIVDTLEAIAEEIDSNAGRVVIAKGAIPIVRPRTRAQRDDNLAAVEVSLTADHIKRLDEVSAISLAIPHDFLAAPPGQNRIAGGKRALLDLPTHAVR